MRSGYYTEKNIDRQAEKYLKELEEFRQYHDWRIQKESCALIIIDMQKYFLDKKSHADIPSAHPTVPRIKELQEVFLDKKMPVIQTRHINNDQNAGIMDKWWADLITEDSPFADIIDELRNENAIIVAKSQYDAFYKTELEKILKTKGIRQIVITGVATHLCCETTARSAFVRGFETFVVVDCVSTWSKEFHLATLLNLSHGFAVPVLAHEIIDAVGSGR